ncbi:MAG: polyphosphate kinase 2 [Chthoniobacterales bacterium]
MAKSKTDASKKEKRKAYEKELLRLQVELVKLQLWVKSTGARVIVLFEGRDAAGKGGVIKRITEHVSPRVFRIVALPAPTHREKTELYLQRYVEHFPAAGEVVIFDRSWYNRAGVEHVMGFCSEKEYKQFLNNTPAVEQWIINSGIQLIKYWFEVTEPVQSERFKSRIDDPLKTWKLSDMDLESHKRWFEYSHARDVMFKATDKKFSPWNVVPADDKKSARLNCISHFLSLIPYKDMPRKKVKLPKRDKASGYQEPKYNYKIIPQKYEF